MTRFQIETCLDQANIECESLVEAANQVTAWVSGAQQRPPQAMRQYLRLAQAVSDCQSTLQSYYDAVRIYGEEPPDNERRDVRAYARQIARARVLAGDAKTQLLHDGVPFPPSPPRAPSLSSAEDNTPRTVDGTQTEPVSDQRQDEVLEDQQLPRFDDSTVHQHTLSREPQQPMPRRLFASPHMFHNRTDAPQPDRAQNSPTFYHYPTAHDHRSFTTAFPDPNERGINDTGSFNLPKLNVPSFSGDFAKWKSFHDMFMSAIGDHPKLTPVMKLQYLKSYVVGDAAKVIQDVPIANENYTTALALLRQYFDQPEQAKTRARTRLINLPAVENNGAALRKFKIELEGCLRELESKGENIEHDHYIDLILSKLPRTLIVQLHRTRRAARWSVAELREQLIREIESEEAADIYIKQEECVEARNTGEALVANTGRSKQYAHREDHSRKKFQPTARQGTRPPTKCVFCDTYHWNSDCCAYPTAAERRQRLMQLRRCTRCFRTGHFSRDCKIGSSLIWCAHCRTQGSHRTALCQAKYQTRPPRNSQSTTRIERNQNISQAMDSRPSSEDPTQVPHNQHNAREVSEGYNLSSNGEQSNCYTYLETAMHTMTDEQGNNTTMARALHDSGSNMSFISKKLAALAVDLRIATY